MSSLHSLVEERVNEVQEILFNKLGLRPFTITTRLEYLKRGVSGLAHIRETAISISYDYLAEFREQVINRTVAHEVCHLYVARYYKNAKQHHGPEFRYLMRVLGCDPSTRHSMQLSTEAQESIKKTRTRYIYEVLNAADVYLTPQQHNKVKLNPNRFTYKGHPIKFTGKAVKI